MNKKNKVLCCIMIIANLSGMFLTGCSEDQIQYITKEEKEIEANISSDSGITFDTIQVYICGEVYYPGVYTLYQGSRVHQAIEQAGGLTKEADINAVNQAKELQDGEKIYIPKVEVAEQSTLININVADESTLCLIPGVGTTRAKQIIAYRDKNGYFESIEDIMNVSGIKQGTFEKMAPYITVY